MLDFANIEKYRENNRIEAKKALGGLPHSIWETYSAFANTLGGYILLGVVEKEDKTFETVDLPDPEGMLLDFWEAVNDPKKTSLNILSAKDVNVQEVDGDHIIVIRVPRADRVDKPIYVDGNPVSGTYKRNGEGDYHCTAEELQAMIRDACVLSQDMPLLPQLETSAFNTATVSDFRRRMREARPGHIWEQLGNDDFLYKIGAAGIGADGRFHPTGAGLLMFGKEPAIVSVYKNYSLEYREQEPGGIRVVSSSGDRNGNVYDFFFRVHELLRRCAAFYFPASDGEAPEDSPVSKALREALANCLVNADYYGQGGVLITKKRGGILLSNPGSSRIELGSARSGGVSDPRNGALMKMFQLIDVGEGSGRGIPHIFRVWSEQGWAEPTITQSCGPDRITLALPLTKPGDREPPVNRGDKKLIPQAQRAQNSVIDYLTDRPDGGAAEIAAALGMNVPEVSRHLTRLAAEGIVEFTGENDKRRWRLKR